MARRTATKTADALPDGHVRIKVRAKDIGEPGAVQVGYFGTRPGDGNEVRRRPGDVFWYEGPEDKLGRWMARVDDDTPLRGKASNDAAREEHERIMSGRGIPRLKKNGADIEDDGIGGSGDPLGD